MTTEEAIKNLNVLKIFDAPVLREAVRMAINALYAQQEPVKLDRSKWGVCGMCGNGETNTSLGVHDFIIRGDVLFCNDTLYGLVGITVKYCPKCGRPLTEEAWAELERRIGGEYETRS